MEKVKVSEIKNKFIQAKANDDFELIDQILIRLNNLPQGDRSPFLDVYNEINGFLFSKNRGSLFNRIKEFRVSPKTSWARKKPVRAAIKPEPRDKGHTLERIDNNLKNFCEERRATFSILKDYYLFTLEVSDPKSNCILLLSDEDSFIKPELHLLLANDGKTLVKNFKLSEFKAELSSNREMNINYGCILFITPGLSERGDFNELEDIFNSFDVVQRIFPYYDNEMYWKEYEVLGWNDDQLRELKNSTNKIFNNLKFDFLEQDIIKKFFGQHSAVLNYKTLKPGASGSGVIEVRASFNSMNESKRYVIKFARIGSNGEGKLALEKKAYDEFVEVHLNLGSADYTKTSNYEAIKYSYASKDGRIDSLDFASYIDAAVNDPANSQCIMLVDKLFSSSLFMGWNKLTRGNFKFKDLYSDYIKNEHKVFSSIKTIWQEELDKNKEKNLITNFLTLREQMITVNKKVCHGDLHSENFFWDRNDIRLIDFGFTKIHHAILDHAFLELSIRFKHIPRYIKLKELMNYEKHFLNKDTFHKGFDTSFIPRDNIREIYSTIAHIRMHARNLLNDQNDLREYWASLFFMSFRQIQYKDLNQLFALEMTSLLGEELISGGALPTS